MSFKVKAVKDRVMQNRIFVEALKENGLSFDEVSIKELKSTGWRVLQKGSEAVELLLIGEKIQIVKSI